MSMFKILSCKGLNIEHRTLNIERSITTKQLKGRKNVSPDIYVFFVFSFDVQC